MDLGTVGAWFGPHHDDPTRIRFAAAAEALGYRAIWLGVGRETVGDLRFFEDVLDATESAVVVPAVVNVFNNDPETVAAGYHRIAGRHPGRFLLGVGVGHPESISAYRRPYAALVEFLDVLDARGVPASARVVGALGDRSLLLSRDRSRGAHPYLTVPEHTRHARTVLGPDALLAPEQKVVLDTDPEAARAVGRPFVERPYLGLVNYVSNLRRSGYTEQDVAGGGSDRLIDALAVHGDVAAVAAGVRAHLDAGADHVGVQVLARPGRDVIGGCRALAEELSVRA